MEALGRVELPTNGLGNRCSIHLSYGARLRNDYLTERCEAVARKARADSTSICGARRRPGGNALFGPLDIPCFREQSSCTLGG